MIAATDKEIVAALKNGDNESLKFVYKTYWPTIARFVRCNGGTDDDAEELYQEGIIALYEKLQTPDFILTCSLKTYIYSICRNKWLYLLRGRKTILDIEEYKEISSEPTEESIELPEDKEIMNVISSMPDPCHSLLIGFYYQHLSLDVLASRLNYSSANVAKQQKFRCLERLKKFFLQKKYNHVGE